jgi:hypothetical protein
MSYQTVLSHYDKPQSHSQTQTRWVLPAGKRIFAPSIKLMDLDIAPNVPCHFSSSVGVYGCIRRIQIRLNKREITQFNARRMLPLLLASLGNNDYQKGVQSVLFGTGNNVAYDPVSKLLTLERPVVGEFKHEILLRHLIDIFNTIQVIDQELEIIIDWMPQNQSKDFLCPVDIDASVSSYTIAQPYLSYETLTNDKVQQPKEVLFREYIQDEWTIDAIATDNTTQPPVGLRSNAYKGKTVQRLILSNTPTSILSTPADDLKILYNLFGTHLSLPQKQENFAIIVNGENLLTRTNVNDATKLAFTQDSWGSCSATTHAHLNTLNSVLKEFPEGTNNYMNGYFSYAVLELNKFIQQDILVNYTRMSDDSNHPSIASQMILTGVAEVLCKLDANGSKVYL